MKKLLILILLLAACTAPQQPSSPQPTPSTPPAPAAPVQPTPPHVDPLPIGKGILEITIQNLCTWPNKINSWSVEIGDSSGGPTYRATCQSPTIRVVDLPAKAWTIRSHQLTYYQASPAVQTVDVLAGQTTQATITLQAVHP